MNSKFDIVIIGGGNAGFGVSAVVSEAGKSIAFIEERDFGGTCPNRGCTPKKVLVAAAHSLHEIELAHTHGIDVGKPKLNWEKLIDRKDDMIGFIPDAMKGVAEKRGSVFRGHARFTGPNTVEVDGTLIEGENIVIATGSKPRPLNIPGAGLMITSDEVLSEKQQPDEVVFVGGGVIAMEFSHVYARAGTKVTILEAMPQLLPRMDEDAVAAIRAETERLGVTIKTDVNVREISTSGGRLKVAYSHDGGDHQVIADRVVNGAGRVANVDTLNLDAANISHDGVRIEVDEHLRSVSNPSVWVAGDALVNSAQLSPLATYEGRLVAHNIIHGPEKTPDYEATPSAVYTVPALSTVGLTEKQATEMGLDVAVTTNDMTGWFSGKSYSETVAWSKVLVDRKTDRVVSAHLVGHHGEDLIHLFSLAMKHAIPASDLKDTPMAFPTFASDVKNLF
ncbi:dihydrolipoyl dehydrogenase family protein [Hoeflea prorocentri]|uniref:NAD(P)/FAD-dependent oxidoreductase n=1 Tax=Hoeflea prorocentri TaxID=1922333 RepID=A0A9X3ZI55_9HYPH|nr:NAD(P)/FAD-dependent oxidoreductase [Hoeflea prorocentri]MCY6382572.1 NAD(P)/FAD-dependent oxidoreductase [Hoeflea prorocentri]MDA5400372.1 NAD(P)/FAD-dependent oxidoreductase [Hoeflea prorocentri]